MNKQADQLQSPHERGVNPWQMLGYLRGALIGDGAITATAWAEAIEASIPASQVDADPPEPCS